MSAKEIWITIKHNDNYEVSNLGDVRNKKTKRILKPAISRSVAIDTFTVPVVICPQLLQIRVTEPESLKFSIL